MANRESEATRIARANKRWLKKPYPTPRKQQHYHMSNRTYRWIDELKENGIAVEDNQNKC